MNNLYNVFLEKCNYLAIILMIVSTQTTLAQCPPSVVEVAAGNQYIFSVSNCAGLGAPITNDDGTTFSFAGCVGVTATYNFLAPPAPTVLPSTFSFGGAIGNCEYDATGMLIPNLVVPTLSEWGLIILALLILSFGTLYSLQPTVQLSDNANYSIQNNYLGQWQILFQKSLFYKIWLFTLISFGLIFTISIYFFGYELTNADIPMSILASAVFAFLVQLLILAERKRP